MEIPYTVTARKDTGLFNSKIGIWLFLASEVMLFGGLFSGYVFLRIYADYPWPERTLPVLPGLINTFVLLVGFELNNSIEMNRLRLEGENPISTEAWFEEEFNKNKSVWAELEGLHHTDHIAKAIQNGTACAVSDGSYFDKFGTSASVICNRQEKEIWARSITPGPAAAQNPHRSELAGVVCSLTIIAAIILCHYFL